MNTTRWTVGEVAISKLLEAEIKLPIEAFFASFLPSADVQDALAIPWARPTWIDENGFIAASMHSFLVEVGGKRLVIDTGIGEDKERAIEMMRKHDGDYLSRLAEAGWTRESVDGVICTHLHLDHVGWNTMLVDGEWVPTFPNATYYFVRKEFEFWQSFADDPHAGDGYLNDWTRDMIDGKAVFNDSVRPVWDAGLVELVEQDAQIEPGLRLQPTPGHTPGHACVVIESAGETAVITGDVMHTVFQIVHPEWSAVLDSDLDESAVARARMVNEWADSGSLVLGTHFPGPTGGYVVRENGALKFVQQRLESS